MPASLTSTASHRCAFSPPWTNLDYSSLIFHRSVLFSLLFVCLHALFWDFSLMCVSFNNSLLCHLSVSPLSHVLALSFSGRDVWEEAGLFAPHGLIQWSGHTYCHTACQSMLCLSQRTCSTASCRACVTAMWLLRSNDPRTAHVLYFCTPCWWEKQFPSLETWICCSPVA